MRRQLLAGLRMVAVMTIVTGIFYPLAMTGLAQGLFKRSANGSLVSQGGVVVGSSLIGQSFAGVRYFHPRPSAAGKDGYDASASGASNLGPTNADYLRTVADRASEYRRENGLSRDATVPVDAVTASGSGLDPDISTVNARLQAARVAKARNLSRDAVLALVAAHTEGRALGFLGSPRVNVLQLNLALDGRR